MGTKRGQALIELAVGLFALTLILSAFFVFFTYILRDLEIQNHLRGNSRGVQDKIDLDAFARDHLFGVRVLHIKEPYSTINHTIP